MRDSTLSLWPLHTFMWISGMLFGLLVARAYKVRKIVVDDPAELRRLAGEIARLSSTLNELVDERTKPKEPASAA